MKNFLLSLFFFTATISSTVSANQPSSLFLIDLTVRGQNIVTAFKIANKSLGTTCSNQSGIGTTTETVLQTLSTPIYSPFVVNGMIPYVTGITPAPNYTLLIVAYLPPAAKAVTQYIVVATDQILDVFYTAQNIGPPAISQNTPYTSTFGSSILPIYNISTVSRAADIVSIVNTLLTDSTYFQPNRSQVWIQTTLNGHFYPTFVNGYIPNVTCIQQIATNSTILQITYQNQFFPGTLGSVFVSAEQVQQIVYYPFNTAPNPSR